MIAGTIALMRGGVAVCALSFGGEIISFLEAVLREGLEFLETIPVTETPGRRAAGGAVPERDALRGLADSLVSDEY